MKYFINLSTRSKLLYSYGLIWLMFLVVIIVAYRGIHDIAQSERELHDVRFHTVIDVLELKAHQNFNRADIYELMLMKTRSGQLAIETTINERAQAVDQIIERVFRRDINVKVRSQLKELQDSLKYFRLARKEVVALIHQGKIEEANRMEGSTQLIRFEKIRLLAIAIVEEGERHTEDQLALDMYEANSSILLFMLVGFVAIIFIVIMVILMNRTIAKPMNAISKIASGITGRNDLAITFPFQDRTDEVGILSKAFRSMVENLRQSTTDIAESKRLEEEMRAASLYARNLIEASLDPLVTISADGKITDVNKTTEDVTGVSRDRLIGSDFADYFTEPDKARAGYKQVFSQGTVKDYPLTLRHSSGKTTSVLYNASVYKNESGQVQGVFAAARDITERKKKDEELRAVSIYVRNLIEASLDPLVTINADGKITDVNKTTEDVTGVSRERLIGSDFADYFTEPDKARAGYKQVFSQGVVRDYPLTLRHSSGKTTDVLYNASVYKNEAGQVQGVFAAARDITERKQKDEELRLASRYARSLIEASLDPLVTISSDGKITDVNKTTEDVTGVSRDRLIGSDFADYFTEPDKARAGYKQVFSQGTVKDYPLTLRHSSGKTTYVLYNASVYKNEAGQVQGVFAAARDITERKQKDEELKSYRDQLEEMVKTRTAALSEVLKEVKETVNVLVSSSSEILAATTQVATGAVETATAISETTTTVEEVRQAAKLSSQKASRVSENAQQVVQVTQTGQKAVDETISGMHDIQNQMDLVATTIVRLSEQSQQIGGIIASVTDVADQSNLLAVNAAIEAAKAGEQGKGFAVVAQEIKSLAQQSKQATIQVRNILSDVQKATSAAVMATEKSSKAVDNGVKQSSQAGESIRLLSKSVDESVQAATQIVASSQQQVVGMDQIGLAMSNVNQSSAENAASMKQTEKAAKDINDLGIKLKQLVEQYQT
jgi:PAS domain S-box-containing protein